MAGSYFKNSALIESTTTTATAAGTTTLTASSATNQQFTGSTTQTVVLPDTTTLSIGRRFPILNRSTGAVTVNFNGGSLAGVVAAGTQTEFVVINNGSSAGTWDLSSASAGTTSPLTTKGDLYGFSTVNARLPVGTDGLPLVADSTQTLGVVYKALPIVGGGTGQITKAPAFDALQPMTTLGDLIVGGVAGTGTRLAGGSPNQVLKWIGTTPGWASSPSGGVNYASSNPDAEVDTTGWSTYSDTSIVTATIASPAVIGWTAHGLSVGQPIIFETTGALPTGLTAGTSYYVSATSTNSFNVSATLGGANVNTSGSQSGSHIGMLLTPLNGAGTGFGGAPNALTLTASSSSPLRGTKSFSISQANSPANVTVTISNATPAVFTTSGSHNLALNQLVYFTTSGGLPTGLSINTPYYVTAVPSGTTFRVSATVGGSDIATSSAGSGTHTLNSTASGVAAGQGVKFPFTIDSADQARVLSVQFDYNASSAFTASNGQTGTIGASGVDSDLECWIYDVTNAALIPLSPRVITAKGGNNFTFKATFQTASNSTSYRLLVHGATSSGAVTGYVFKFDNVFIGPQAIVQGPPITDLSNSYACVITGDSVAGSIAYTANTLFYGRIGDSVRVVGNIRLGTVTTAPTGNIYINLPPGLSRDTSKEGDGGRDPWGTTACKVNAAATTINFLGIGAPNAQSLAMASGSAVAPALITGDEIKVEFMVPIVGWSSTTQMSNDTDTRPVVMEANGLATGTVAGSYNTTIFPTVNKDTHSSYNATTGIYTVPVSGFYSVRASIGLSGTLALNSAELITINMNGFQQFQNQQISGGAVTANRTLQVSGTYFMTAGQQIYIQSFSSAASPAYSNAGAFCYFCVERVSGLSAIAATDSVNARYTFVGNSNLPNATNENLSSTYATYTKVKDTHGAFNTSTGVYTVPIAGSYMVSLRAFCNPTSASAGTMAVSFTQAGSASTSSSGYSAFGSVSGFTSAQVCDIVSCQAGDTITLAAIQNNSTNNLPLGGVASGNAFSITRVGN